LAPFVAWIGILSVADIGTLYLTIYTFMVGRPHKVRNSAMPPA
jgi:hypothetical protein